MHECLKYNRPTQECMQYAIASGNVDFVTFLMNDFGLRIYLNDCRLFHNLQAFLIYLDQTNDVSRCFPYSGCFNIPLLCEFLLYKGADLNACDNWDYTALHIATIHNNKEVVEFLISRGADINAISSANGYSALHLSIGNNDIEFAEFLISHGADLNVKEKNGQTPLNFAAINSKKDFVELLLLHGANPNEIDCWGNTAAYYINNY